MMNWSKGKEPNSGTSGLSDELIKVEGEVVSLRREVDMHNQTPKFHNDRPAEGSR